MYRTFVPRDLQANIRKVRGNDRTTDTAFPFTVHTFRTVRNNQPGELDTKGGSVFIDFGENRGMAGVPESERIRDAVGREGDIAVN